MLIMPLAKQLFDINVLKVSLGWISSSIFISYSY
jgi:hypothetical protein